MSRFARSDFIRAGAAAVVAPLSVFALEARVQAAPDKTELAVLSGLGPVILGAYARGTTPRPDGAVGANTTGFIQVGFQDEVFAHIMVGITQQNARVTGESLDIAEYAFDRQRPDGSFAYSESNGVRSTGAAPNPAAPASSAAVFLADFGHAALLARSDTWFTTSSAAAPYRARLDALQRKSVASLDWLLGQQGQLATDTAAANRILIHGQAYYCLGRALGRKDAMAIGRGIFMPVFDSVGADGTFREGSGFDSSYQAANLLKAQWIYLNLAPPDADLRERIWPVVQRGIARENQAILPSGEVSTVGNSRVRAGGESYLGHVKGVNTKELLFAIGYYAQLSQDPAALSQMRLVLQRYFPQDAQKL